MIASSRHFNWEKLEWWVPRYHMDESSDIVIVGVARAADLAEFNHFSLLFTPFFFSEL